MKILIFLLILLVPFGIEAKGTLSEATKACIECHEIINPGIVNDWKKSKHYEIGSIGCAECHTGKERPDSFPHNGYMVHKVVSPKDCALCHTVEAKEYENNIMSHAYENLMYNSLFKDLARTVNHFEEGILTQEDSCLSCHGTNLKVNGLKERETFFGKMRFVSLDGWPNTGSGRINPDGSKGSCSACHARHSFSVGIARNPASCSRCHKGPDVPAYKIYVVSKHGIIYESRKKGMNLEPKPWILGRDYNVPTCATCHISEVRVNGEIMVKRTHMIADRLSHRLFGIPYATNYPKSPETYKAKNKLGLPLLSELNGEQLAEYVIDKEEQSKREKTMKSVCLACHSSSFVHRHFLRIGEAISTTNKIVKESTDLLMSTWKRGLASQENGIFNEVIERLWVEKWLFYGNSVRLASAMGGADYGVFEGGRWNLTYALQKMKEWMRVLFFLTEPKKTGN